MNQQTLLESDDPQLAANKKLVYDFWRTVLRARDMSNSSEYLSERYIQHNPNVASGREPFVRFMSGAEPGDVEATIPDLVTIFAENDMVIMAFRREFDNPRNGGSDLLDNMVRHVPRRQQLDRRALGLRIDQSSVSRRHKTVDRPSVATESRSERSKVSGADHPHQLGRTAANHSRISLPCDLSRWFRGRWVSWPPQLRTTMKLRL